MIYKAITIYPPQEELEALAAKLAQHGVGVVINDPGELEGFLAARDAHLWDYAEPGVLEGLNSRPSVTFYLEEGEERPELIDVAGKYEFAQVLADDEEWLHKWEEFFMPTKLSERFVVRPAWREYNPKAGEKVISIDPGQAFGTGTHATTFLSLRLMEKYLKPGCNVLDVGSGSGILSVGAIMLGASEVLGVDLFAEAVESTLKNAALNGCEGKIRAIKGDLTRGIDYKADLVVSNLMADLVIMLSKDVAKNLKGTGIYISSGIPDDKENAVRAAIIAAGFEIMEAIHADGWCAIAAKLSAHAQTDVCSRDIQN